MFGVDFGCDCTTYPCPHVKLPMPKRDWSFEYTLEDEIDDSELDALAEIGVTNIWIEEEAKKMEAM